MMVSARLAPPARLAVLRDAYGQAVAAKRRRLALGAVLLALALLLSGRAAEVDLGTLFGKFGNFTSYIGRILLLESGRPVWTDPVDWFWGLPKWSRLLLETLLMAYVGTLTGALGAFALSFPASGNLVRSRLLRGVVRRFLEFCRTVPELVFALIFVVAFGLGPLAGVLAIAIHTMGALGKLFAEVNENIDMKPVEGIAATGAGWTQRMRFGVVPQVQANFVSYGLLRFEINVRGASVMGFVGAGGIGQDLVEAIRKFYYADVSALLLLIILTVVAIDMLGERLRHRLAGDGSGA